MAREKSVGQDPFVLPPGVASCPGVAGRQSEEAIAGHLRRQRQHHFFTLVTFAMSPEPFKDIRRARAHYLVPGRRAGLACELALHLRSRLCAYLIEIKKGPARSITIDLREKRTEWRPSFTAARIPAIASKALQPKTSDADINKAMDAASWSMIELLQKEKSLSRLDAYALASMTMDCRVGEMEAAEKGVHCLVPKSLWIKR
jgi:hypothetical protein